MRVMKTYNDVGKNVDKIAKIVRIMHVERNRDKIEKVHKRCAKMLSGF